LGGVAALLHKLYNGIEKTLKFVIKDRNISIPKGPSWHKDLINVAVENKIIENNTAQIIKQYLAFRHFFINSYVVNLEAERLKPLLDDANILYKSFKHDLKCQIAS